MKLKFIAQSTAAILIAATSSAAADQFAIQTAEPVAVANERLLEALDIREIDAVEIDGVHFVVVEARDEGYIAAYVFAMSIEATGLYRLEADWDGNGMSSLPLQAREPFLQETACAFCTS